MKNNLGKNILLLTFLFASSLFASSQLASYTLTTNKTDAYVKEAVEVTFVAKQKDHTNVMFFFLKPKQNPAYEIHLLNKETTEISYHNFTTTFKYILFPLRKGDIDVDFDFTIKEASDQAVAQVYTGSRDNVKWIETEDTHIDVKPLRLHVKPIEADVDLVGEFQLKAAINKTTINQYESVNIVYTLSGRGYKDNNISIINSIQDVTIFSEIHDAYSKLTTQGYIIKRDFIYALSATKTFQIPAVKLKIFSPVKKKYYTLEAPTYTINVQKIDTDTLIDDKDAPQTQQFISLKKLQEILIYLLLFISGYLTAKYMPTSFQKREKKEQFVEIKKAKTPKELLKVLTNNYSHTLFKEEIALLETMVYAQNGDTINLNTIKKQILKKLQ